MSDDLNEYESRASEALSRVIVDALLHGADVDLMKLAARKCGWLPLQIGETMTVHYGGRAYRVTREE